ncbi:MAG: glycosyltransferase [Candidatus Helarchaeota archaeon]
MPIKISVVVPTYNEEKGIEKFLKQFQYQSLPRNQFEIIIVDGNSTDRTREIAQKYADKVFIQQSKGVGGARNDGVAAASAEIIATTDADTLVSRQWLEQIVRHFEKDKDLIFLFGSNYPMTDNKTIRFFAKLKALINLIFARLHIAYLAEGPNSAFRKNEFLEVGGYADLPVMDDTEITSRMRKKGKIKYDYSLFVYASTRRMEKTGTSRTGYVLITSYFKLVLFGKESIQVKDYAKQEY